MHKPSRRKTEDRGHGRTPSPASSSCLLCFRLSRYPNAIPESVPAAHSTEDADTWMQRDTLCCSKWGLHCFAGRPMDINTAVSAMVWICLPCAQSSRGFPRRYWGPLEGKGTEGVCSKGTVRCQPFLCFLLVVHMLALRGTSLVCCPQPKSKAIGPAEPWT